MKYTMPDKPNFKQLPLKTRIKLMCKAVWAETNCYNNPSRTGRIDCCNCALWNIENYKAWKKH